MIFRSSIFLQEDPLIANLRAGFQGGTCYNLFMNHLSEVAFQFGLHGAVVAPDVFCACRPLTGNRCLREANSGDFDMHVVKKTSWAVNSFYQSGENSKKTLVERGSHAQIRAGSFQSSLQAYVNELCEAGPAAMRRSSEVVGVDTALQPPECCWQPEAAGRRKRAKSTDERQDVANPIPWTIAIPSVEEYRLPRALSYSGPSFDACHIHRQVQLSEVVGKGAYGTVYVGKYKHEARPVAVKVEVADRVHHELRSCVEIFFLCRGGGHPNVIRVLDYFYSPWLSVLVLEHWAGSLPKILDQFSDCGGLRQRTAFHVLQGIDSGLKHLHDNHILHRDLHVGNVLVNVPLGCSTKELAVDDVRGVCICDLGQACDVRGDAPGACHSGARGALSCVPPEEFFMQAKKVRYYKPADVWAVGTILVQMVGGKVFRGASAHAELQETVANIIGNIEKVVVKKYAWRVPLKLVSERLAASPRVRSPAGDPPSNAHANIMRYDPAARPTAGCIYAAVTR